MARKFREFKFFTLGGLENIFVQINAKLANRSKTVIVVQFKLSKILFFNVHTSQPTL
jgi:hypothetical protein